MPRMQKINKNTNKTDKNTFTGDKNSSNIMKIQTLPGDNIISNKKNKKSKSKERINDKNKSLDNTELKEIEDINKLQLLLEQKNDDLQKLKNDKINETNDINNQIFEKNLKIDSLTNNTTILLNKLTNISKDIDLQYSKYNIDLEIEKQKSKIKKEKKEYENNLKNNIIRGKNSKQHYKNIIDMLKIQKEKLEKIIKEETDERINENKVLLENLIQKEDKLKNKILILNNIKNKHIKLCDEKKEKLENILDRVKNEYEYENKRNEKKINNSLKDTNSNEDNNKNNKSLPKINRNKIYVLVQKKDNKYSFETLLNNNRQSSDIIKKTFSDKNILIKEIDNENSIFKSFTKKNNMEKDLNLIKRRILIMKKLNNNPFISDSTNANNSLLSNINLNNNKSNISDTNKSSNTNFLFSKTEKNYLSKIVPNECLEKYEEKFNNLEEQRQIWKEKIKDNITQKKINSHQNYEIEFTQLKRKAINQKMVKLHSKLSEIKKNINNIKNENKNIYKKYIDIKNKYKKKKNENEKMLNYFQKFYSEIKNNKIKLKKGQKLNQEEIKAINKWGGPNDLYIMQNNESESDKGYNEENDDDLEKKENNDGKEENKEEEEKNEEYEENEINGE